MRLAFLLLVAAALQAQPEYTFGTTVVSTSGFQGRIFHIDRGTQRLPNLDRAKPVGSIYTTALNVWPQRFNEGFPGITERFEWFAIDYQARIWIETEGRYRFSMLSDDGARLVIDNQLVIDNDGQHPASAYTGSAVLTRGVHRIRVWYFQGPRFSVALVLAVAPPSAPFRILDTNDFSPPKDPAEWVDGRISSVRIGSPSGNEQ